MMVLIRHITEPTFALGMMPEKSGNQRQQISSNGLNFYLIKTLSKFVFPLKTLSSGPSLSRLAGVRDR